MVKKSVIMKRISFLILQILLLTSCEELIEYSPYSTYVKEELINSRECEKIRNNCVSDNDTLKFAVISDVHDDYDNMSDALFSISNQEDIQFIICNGDITNFGLAKEFEWYSDMVNQSAIPLITLIGNHDYRSNGLQIFERLFGPVNTSFEAGNYHFILFSIVILENNNMSPKYEWLIDEISDSNKYHIVVTHVPPFSGEMEGIHNLAFRQIVNPENTILCLHGHVSHFDDSYYNGIHTVITNKIFNREYSIISLVGDKSFVKRVNF